MTLLNNGLNKIRDLTSDEVTGIILGTGTVIESATDTGLNSPIGTTFGAVSTTKTDRKATYSYTLNSVQGTGFTYAELGVEMTGTVYLNRVTFFPLTKNANEEFNFESSTFFTQA